MPGTSVVRILSVLLAAGFVTAPAVPTASAAPIEEVAGQYRGWVAAEREYSQQLERDFYLELGSGWYADTSRESSTADAYEDRYSYHSGTPPNSAGCSRPESTEIQGSGTFSGVRHLLTRPGSDPEYDGFAGFAAEEKLIAFDPQYDGYFPEHGVTYDCYGNGGPVTGGMQQTWLGRPAGTRAPEQELAARADPDNAPETIGERRSWEPYGDQVVVTYTVCMSRSTRDTDGDGLPDPVDLAPSAAASPTELGIPGGPSRRTEGPRLQGGPTGERDIPTCPSSTSALPPQDFRPILLFDSRDPYRPVSLDAFVAERDDGETAHRICHDVSFGGDDCRPLGSLADFGETGDYIDINRGRAVPGGHDARALEEQLRACNAPDGLRDCESGPRTVIYAHPSRSRGSLWIDYWFFYRFNITALTSAYAVGTGPLGVCRGLIKPELTCFDHEGDWEGVTIELPDVPRPQRPISVTYAAHHDAYRYLWESLVQLGATVGTRPKAFVAFGSHATYPVGCNARICFQPNGIPEGRTNGKRPWPNNDASACVRNKCIRTFSTADRWATWPGRWGKQNDYGFGTRGFGPVSPGLSDRYQAPGVPFGAGAVAAQRGHATTASAVAACRGWMGPHVVAAACDGSDSDQVAQAVSLKAPRTGAPFRFPQRAAKGSILLVRRGRPGRQSLSQFKLTRPVSARSALRVTGAMTRRPVLRLPGGSRLRARAVTPPPPRPVRRLRARSRAGRISVRFVATAARAHIALLDRRGVSTKATTVRTRGGRTTRVKLKAPRAAKLTVIAQDSHSQLSRPAFTRIR